MALLIGKWNNISPLCCRHSVQYTLHQQYLLELSLIYLYPTFFVGFSSASHPEARKNQESHLLLKRQDRRISIIGALILVALTLAAGISVYVVMQRQAESLLSKSLGVSLQNNQRSFQNEIEQSLYGTQAEAKRPFAIQNLRLLASKPGNATAPADLQRIAQAALLTLFTGLSF